MHTRILVSLLLLLVLLKSLSTAGAIGERRGSNSRVQEGSDDPSLAIAPRMSEIHFPGPQDSLPSKFKNSEHWGRDSSSSGATGSPEGSSVTPVPEVRPLLDEEKLIQFDANGGKNVWTSTTEKPPNEQPSEGPDSSAAKPGATVESSWSQLSDILRDILNATGDQEHDQTPRPLPAVNVPQPSSSIAEANNEFEKFLPHLEEALMKALEEEAAEKHLPPTTTRRPPKPPDSGEELFEDILPALEEQIVSILEKSKDDRSSLATLLTPSPTPTPSHPTLPTRSEFDDFLPQLERVFSDILYSTESDTDNELGTKPKPPNTALKPSLSPFHVKQSSTSTHSSLEPSVHLIHALETSLTGILKDETSQVPVSWRKPADQQENLVVPQAKIVRVLNKYYPQLMKVLEEIVREEEAISAGSPSPPQSSRI